MIQYLPVENEIGSSSPYRTFGLRVFRQEDGEEAEEIMLLPDISTNFEFTLRLASLFTRKQLSPLRLLDVLETLL